MLWFDSSAYTIKIANHVSGTGPVSSTVSAMELDITFDGKVFSRLQLPEFKTQSGGMELVVPTQRVHITDMETYMNYVKAVITSKETKFELANGVCKVKALGITAKCDFRREFSIAGMNGPDGEILDVRREDEDVIMTVKCLNPSPVEIDQGIVIFELRNEDKECMAELRGHVQLVRGEFDVVLRGRTKPGVKPSKKMTLQGVGAEEKTWRAQTAKFVEVTLDMRPDFVNVLEDHCAGVD